MQHLPPTGPIVYVAPRFGFAGIALAWLAWSHRRRLVLFMPSSKRISTHQAVAIELGAEPRFLRVAAMPNLNRAAHVWATRNRGTFVPLGLRHELVTAAIVRTAVELGEKHRGLGGRMWTAISTGVLSRGLQIGLPALPFHGVAVARNIKAGERGDARLSSYHLSFEQDSEVRPPFPCASNYDAKAWHHMTQDGEQGDWFWNVAGDAQAQHLETFNADSQRDWGDDRDLRS